jgi:hypothetical protein
MSKVKDQWEVIVQVEGHEQAAHTVWADSAIEAVCMAVQEEIRVSGYAAVGMVEVISAEVLIG